MYGESVIHKIAIIVYSANKTARVEQSGAYYGSGDCIYRWIW